MKRSLSKILFSFVCFLLYLSFTNQASANQLKSVRLWSSVKNTRLVFNLTSPPKYNVFYLKKPNRMIIDLAFTKNRVNLARLKHKGNLVKKIRQGSEVKKGECRIVIELNYASKAKYFSLKPNRTYGNRLVVDLPHKLAQIAVNLPHKVAQKDKPNEKTTDPPQRIIGHDVIIAVDAGHGGGDPGALGVITSEKNVTLKIAKYLKARIDKQKGMHAFLTRKGDYYVDLTDRSKIAKKGKADFLVSIHADGFSSSRPRGASVWILSNKRASTEEVRRMQRHEIHSELLSGHRINEEHPSSESFLNSAFFDMSRSNSMEVGAKVGRLVANELKKVTYMHKKNPVEASLAVLKSPYLPSILVEAGFITNPKEERLLNKPSFQMRISDAIFQGIYKYFLVYSPYDSLFAMKKRVLIHTVRRGDSLSIVSHRYGISVPELKSYNNLSSIHLNIGQKLKIPSNYQLSDSKDQKVVAQKIQKNTRYRATKLHRVRRGESLSIISKKYNTNVASLKKYNKLTTTSLEIGQKIKIPAQREKTKVVAQQPSMHIVKRGESLSVISHRYGKSLTAIRKHNKLRTTSLAIGQKIKIPAQAEKITVVAQQPSMHIVKRGESLSIIAHRYGKSLTAIKKYNKLRTTSLAIGQKIKIPNVTAALNITIPKQLPYKRVVHKVRKGESLSIIAQYYGKSLLEVKSYNKLSSSKVRIGQKIKIPKMMSTLAKHKVNSGETLSIIGHRYGIKTSSLKLFNHLRSNSLAIGQVLTIPFA